MRKPIRIVVVLGGLAIWWLVMPELHSGFRAEDFLAFDYYGAQSLASCFTDSHLGSFIVRFFRPLGDAVTWCMVRGLGSDSTWHHLVLWLLHGATALATFAAARRLCRLPAPAAAAAAFLVLAHPLAATVLLYVDGGVPQILLGLCIMGALAGLGRWRDGGSSVPLWIWTVLAVLTFDTGMALPVLLVCVAWLLPRARRRVPWAVLGLVPAMLVWRLLVLGEMGGYGVHPTRETLGYLVDGYQRLIACTLAPVFAELPADVHGVAWRVIAPGCLAVAVALTLAARAGSRERSTASSPAEGAPCGGIALAAFAIAWVIGAAPDGALEAGMGKPSYPLMLYRTYAASCVMGLALVAVLGALAGGRGPAVLVAVTPLVVCWVLLGRPLREEAVATGRQVDRIREDLVQLVDPDDPRPVFLFATPLARYRGERPVSRLLNYGLSTSCRPPFHERDLAVFPVFQPPRRGDLYVKLQTLERLLAFEGLRPFQYRSDLDRVEAVGERPTLPPPTVRLLSYESGSTEDSAAPLSVPVSADGAIQLRVEGSTAGFPVLHLFNRRHQYFAAELPYAGASLRRVPDPDGGADVLLASARQIQELAHHHPDDLVLAVLEVGPLPGQEGPVSVSNVLPIRLSPATE